MTEKQPKKFYRQRYVVEVLTENQPLPDYLDLYEIGYEIDGGICVGQVVGDPPEEVTPQEMVELLSEFGSEPAFFGLDRA